MWYAYLSTPLPSGRTEEDEMGKAQKKQNGSIKHPTGKKNIDTHRDEYLTKWSVCVAAENPMSNNKNGKYYLCA